MKKLALGLGIIGAIAVAAILLGRGAAARDEDRSPGAEVVRVIRRDIGSAVTATGVVKPMIGAEVRVGSRISGIVGQLRVRLGEAVVKGQLLAELEDRELRAR